MRLAPGAAVAGVFTQNRFLCRAGSPLPQEHPQRCPRARPSTTGNANAGTGKDGLHAPRRFARRWGRRSGCKSGEVLPFSTGVIMEPLASDRIVAGLSKIQVADWRSAAEAIRPRIPCLRGSRKKSP